MAFNVIENLSSKLKVIERQENEEGISIKKDVLDNINKELAIFIDNKSKLCTMLKEQHKQAISQVELMSFPDLSLFLEDKYVLKPKKFSCDCCSYTSETKAQMSAHKKKHKTDKSEHKSMKNLVDELPESVEFTNMNLSQLKDECKKRKINTSGKKKDDLIELIHHSSNAS